jgi:hypothetical protein
MFLSAIENNEYASAQSWKPPFGRAIFPIIKQIAGSKGKAKIIKMVTTLQVATQSILATRCTGFKIRG